MVSGIGKFLRHIRVDESENLREMAEKLEVSSAFLSAVEVGKKQVPKSWGSRIAQLYGLSGDKEKELLNAIDETNGKVVIELDKICPERGELSMMFARTISGANQQTLEQLRTLLKKSSD